MDKTKAAKILVLFIVFYAVLYFLPYVVTQLHKWDFWSITRAEYTFFLIPIPAFFFLYFLVDWIDEFFETELAHTPILPLIFVMLSFLAFYAQLYFYWGNFAYLQNQQGGNVRVIIWLFTQPAATECSANICLDYFNLLNASAFLVFVFAGIFGWLAHMIAEHWAQTEEKKKETKENTAFRKSSGAKK